MATSITLRSTKGSALTHTEVDDNFSNLKTTADAAAPAGAITASGLTVGTGKLLGRTTASTGAIEQISAGTGLTLSSGTLSVDFTGYLTTSAAASAYQPLDADLTAIAGLAGTSGLLKKTAADTWSLDTSTYLTTTDAASTYQTQSGMSSYLTTSSASSTYLTQTNAASTYLTQSNAASTYQTQSGMSSYLTTATASSTYQTQAGMSSYLTTSSAASTYQPLDGDLTAIAALTTTGVLTRSGANTWAIITNPSGDLVGTTATQTLTNKTLTGYTETVYTISDGASVDINPANGTIQLWTLGANRTPTASSFAAGQSVTLMIDDGTAYAVTWTTINVTWVGGTAPTLPTSGYGVIQLWKAGTKIYGASVGNVA